MLPLTCTAHLSAVGTFYLFAMLLGSVLAFFPANVRICTVHLSAAGT